MRIGDLVRGKVNDCIGVVTEVVELEHATAVKVYWVVMQLRSTIWQRQDELEIICE